LIWILISVVGLVTAFIAQALILREPLACLRESQPELFENIDGVHALGGGWYTWRFTFFLLNGRFDDIESDAIISKFTMAMWISRICYLAIFICVVLTSAF
jgi:hypothetical protein